MSLRVIGYSNGTRHILVLEPARARPVGFGGVSAGYFGGTVIDTESERDRQLRMQREAMRKARAK